MEQLNISDIPLRQSPCQKTIIGKGGLARLRSVLRVGLFGFSRKIERFGRMGLHSKRHFVLRDTRQHFRIARLIKRLTIQSLQSVERATAMLSR